MSKRNDNAVRHIEAQIEAYSGGTSPLVRVGYHMAATALIELAQRQGDISDAEYLGFYRRLDQIAEQMKGAA